jgi:L-seryl-tRNA(Ser) seleniumtransferase
MLGFYLTDSWKDKIKLWRLAARDKKELKKLAEEIIAACGKPKILKIAESEGQMGGGSLPGVPLKSMAIVFDCDESPNKLADKFRLGAMPVIGRIKDEKFMLDLKAVDNDEVKLLVQAIKSVLSLIK